ncbi:MAG: ferredoxin [Elusimicrobia bacterium]|nr:ferredoxin [Elusimicrobiota bacterium]
MKVTIDETLCTGCGLCEQLVSDVFEVVDNIARVKVAVVPSDLEESVEEAADSCPAEAIIVEK